MNEQNLQRSVVVPTLDQGFLKSNTKEKRTGFSGRRLFTTVALTITGRNASVSRLWTKLDENNR